MFANICWKKIYKFLHVVFLLVREITNVALPFNSTSTDQERDMNVPIDTELLRCIQASSSSESLVVLLRPALPCPVPQSKAVKTGVYCWGYLAETTSYPSTSRCGQYADRFPGDLHRSPPRGDLWWGSRSRPATRLARLTTNDDGHSVACHGETRGLQPAASH